MKANKYLNIHLFYFLFSLSTIPFIIFIFKNIHPKNLAALFAGSVFVAISLTVLICEGTTRRAKAFKSFSFWGALGFLLLFSLPMLMVRILNYDTEFEQLTLLWMPAPQFHKVSNYGFILMVLCFALDWFKSTKTKVKIEASDKI